MKAIKQIGLAMIIGTSGCHSGTELNNPRREVVLNWFGFDGYTISQGNILYRYRNNSISKCELDLGNDSVLYDYDCDSVVDNFDDNQGSHVCSDYALFLELPEDERCNLATQIFQQKKEMLEVNRIHEAWLEYMKQDRLQEYLR